MLKDLIFNILILISVTFIAGHILKEIPGRFADSTYSRLVMGLGGGALAVVLMMTNIRVEGTNTLLDLRALAVIIVSSLGGIVSTVVSGLIILIYRLGHYGINQSSLFAVLHVVLYVSLFHIIDLKIQVKWKAWFSKLIITLIILISTFCYLLSYIPNIGETLVEYTLAFIAVGTAEYFLIQYVHSTNELYRKYKKDSSKDFLTGLNNTRQFDEAFNECITRAQEKREKLSCLMIDIDHFKKVNDTYGHGIGDIVLKQLAQILRETCRGFDIISRVGGEEFCILLLDCPSIHAHEVGMRVRNAVRNCRFVIGEDKTINITVSIGSSTYPDNTEDPEQLVEAADEALYEAKHAGRDRVCDKANISE